MPDPGGDALDQARRIARRDVSSSEIVEATIARIEALNPTFNIVVAERFERALEEAREPRPGPFSGVPLLLKELTPYPDWPSTMACRALAGSPGGQKSEFVRRIEAAGFIVLGRTNSSEFGALPTTQPDLFGATRNPWNIAHDAGGSSGGAAAAVASGMVPIAQGGDAGGSIRIPASACGVFGLKPSRGRISPFPAANPDGFGNHHVLTASVRDSAAFLDVVKGSIAGDRWSLPYEAESYLQQVESPPATLRIAVAAGGFMTDRPAHPDCVRVVEDAAILCEAFGHRIEIARPALDHEHLNEQFLAKSAIGAAQMVDRLAARAEGLSTDGVGRWIRDMAAWGRGLPPWAHTLAAEAFQNAAYRIAAFMDDYDVILTPVLHALPAEIGGFDRIEDFATLRREMLAYAPHTPIVNATGLPACSIPMLVGEHNLPAGVHAIGRMGEEGTLLHLARQIEQARPWPLVATR